MQVDRMQGPMEGWYAAGRKGLCRVVAALAFLIGLALLPAGGVARAEDGPVLVVSGAIEGGAPVSFTRAELTALGMTSLTTETPWMADEVLFEGPLLRDLLKRVGATGDRIEAVALNNYRVEIPLSDATGYDVILAMRVGGKDMSIRDRGPLWLIYPWSGHEELRQELYYSRAIWQIREIIVVDSRSR